MLVLASLDKTRMAYSRDEERSLISSFNKDQRKYGSTSTYISRPERFISYEIQPGDTLQGISLKNNVTMEQLRRANRLWTNDSLALRRTLLVPVPLESTTCSTAASDSLLPPSTPLTASTSLDSLQSCSSSATRSNGHAELDRSEQSAADFLSGIDSVIASSRRHVKQLQKCQPLCESDEACGEDVLYVRGTPAPAHPSEAVRRLNGCHWTASAAASGCDPVAVPLTAVVRSGCGPGGQSGRPAADSDIFEL